MLKSTKRKHKDYPVFYSQGLYAFKWGDQEKSFQRTWEGVKSFTAADPATARAYFNEGWDAGSKVKWDVLNG